MEGNGVTIAEVGLTDGRLVEGIAVDGFSLDGTAVDGVFDDGLDVDGAGADADGACVATHAANEVCPVNAVDVPAGQEAHEVCPVCGWHVLTAHFVAPVPPGE